MTMKNLKKSQKDILPINWYWPKNEEDFSRLSDKIVENTTTIDNDKKIASNTEKIINDAKKKLSGKTVAGRLVTADDFEKLLSSSVEQNAKEMAFGEKTGKPKGYNAAMQIAISGRMLAMQKAIARAGIPDQFMFVDDENKELKKKINTDVLQKAKTKKRDLYTRNGFSIPPGSLSYMDVPKKTLGIIPEIVPQWGADPVDPANPEKVTYSGAKGAIGRAAQFPLNILAFAAMYGLDIANATYSGATGGRSIPGLYRREYANEGDAAYNPNPAAQQNIIYVSPLQRFLQGQGALASRVMGAQIRETNPNGSPVTEKDPGISYNSQKNIYEQNPMPPATITDSKGNQIPNPDYEKLPDKQVWSRNPWWWGGGFPTLQQRGSEDPSIIISNGRRTRVYTDPKMKQKARTEHEQQFDSDSYRSYLNSLFDSLRLQYGKSFADKDQNHLDHWNIIPEEWEQEKAQPFFNSVNYEALENQYKKDFVEKHVNEAKDQWNSMYDPTKEGLTAASGRIITPKAKRFSTKRIVEGFPSPDPTKWKGHQSAVLDNFRTEMLDPNQISQDPFWQHAFSHSIGNTKLHVATNPEFTHTPKP